MKLETYCFRKDDFAITGWFLVGSWVWELAATLKLLYRLSMSHTLGPTPFALQCFLCCACAPKSVCASSQSYSSNSTLFLSPRKLISKLVLIHSPWRQLVSLQNWASVITYQLFRSGEIARDTAETGRFVAKVVSRPIALRWVTSHIASCK